MDKKYLTTWFYAEMDSEIKEVGFFNKKPKKFYGERNVNLNDFSQRLEDAYNDFDKQGYDVVNVISIDMGTSEQCVDVNRQYVGDVGFSITRGAVVVGKKRECDK